MILYQTLATAAKAKQKQKVPSNSYAPARLEYVEMVGGTTTSKKVHAAPYRRSGEVGVGSPDGSPPNGYYRGESQANAEDGYETPRLEFMENGKAEWRSND